VEGYVLTTIPLKAQNFPAPSECADPSAILPQIEPSLTLPDPARQYDSKSRQNSEDMAELSLPALNPSDFPKLQTSGFSEFQASNCCILTVK
jgi:hypothetical protein